MAKLLLLALAATAVAALFVRMTGSSTAAEGKKGPAIIHDVYFSLNDKSGAQALVDACHKYLAPQPGVTFFAVGVSDPSFDRPVNDRDWDVGLHVVFADKAAHDRYQTDDKHNQFIAENKANWSKVRVFDTVGR